jgi:Na+/H+-dicarboxylate symporter
VSIVELSRAFNRPAVTLSAVAIAFALGWMSPPLLQYLRPIGDFYVSLLQMCVLPFLLATIPLAVRSAMTSGTVGSIIRLSTIFGAIALVVVAVTAFIVPITVFYWFGIDEDALARIGLFIGGSADRIDIEFSLEPARRAVAPATQTGILSIVPTNIFASLASNDSMRVMVFAAIFGIAMVTTERQSGTSIFGALQYIQAVCILIFDWFALLVPVGIVALIAPQVASIGPELFTVVAMLACALLATSALVLIGSFLIVIARLRLPARVVCANMLKPTMLAASTCNALVCIPLALSTMRDDLKVAKESCELWIPIGFATLRFGTVMFFITVTLFMGTLTGRTFDVTDWLWIALLSTAASFATLGASGLAALTPLATVLRPFGLSYEVAVPLMIIVEPVANMLRTMVNVVVNCTIPALAGGLTGGPKAPGRPPSRDDAVASAYPSNIEVMR